MPSNRRKVAEHLANWFGAVCCLCGGEVDFAHRGRHPGAPNVDHIVPKDPLHGSGLDYWGNVQLVHEHCNLQKNSLALPQPEAWLYAELLAEAINKFDYSDSYEPSPLAELRDAATKLVAMSRMEARYFEMALESSRPDDLQERAVKHLAKFERRAAEAIQAVVEAQETRRSSRG